MGTLYLKGVRSYNPTCSTKINFNKRINIFWGQNGSGKSTISGYFYFPDDPQYSQCSFETNNSYNYLVYNNQFVIECFYKKAEQPGIFTLSKNNKEAIEFIENKKEEYQKLQQEIELIDTEIKKINDRTEAVSSKFNNDVWKKTDDIRNTNLKVLLTGFLRKDLLSKQLEKIYEAKNIDIINLENEYNTLVSYKNTKINEVIIPQIYQPSYIELELLKTSIISSDNSYLSELINELCNSDWVQEGINYIRDERCPFCQKETINLNFTNEIKQLFDNTYNENLEKISFFLKKYESENKNYISRLKASLINCEYIKKDHEIWRKIQSFESLINNNIMVINSKIQKPSIIIELNDISEIFNEITEIINGINLEIKSINQNVINYNESESALKLKLWEMIKFRCKDIISYRNSELSEFESTTQNLEQKKNQYIKKQLKLYKEISEKEKEISSIDETIDNINNTLISLGINQFKIAKHENDKNLFYLVRDNGDKDNVYHSLSEGEKTIITFLYFIELCLGSNTQNNSNSQTKFIVIDDPISSLSISYIYEISSLIRCKLIEKQNNFKFVILTHNLFFLQELLIHTKTKEKDFKKHYSLYKITKNQYSAIEELKREEIKNDYQSLWVTLKDARDKKINPRAAPNLMRNILEYYFSFQCNRDELKKVLDDLANGENILVNRAFYRYVNNGSHSNSVSSDELISIPVDRYFEMFKKIFIQTNNLPHYEAMMNEDNEEESHH